MKAFCLILLRELKLISLIDVTGTFKASLYSYVDRATSGFFPIVVAASYDILLLSQKQRKTPQS
jgi:hypothetical protein